MYHYWYLYFDFIEAFSFARAFFSYQLGFNWVLIAELQKQKNIFCDVQNQKNITWT